MASDFGFRRAKEIALDVAAVGKEHGFSERDMFVAFAALVGSKNLNFARQALDALRKSVERHEVARVEGEATQVQAVQ